MTYSHERFLALFCPNFLSQRKCLFSQVRGRQQDLQPVLIAEHAFETLVPGQETN